MDGLKPGEPIPSKLRDWYRDDSARADKWRREIWEPAQRIVHCDQWDSRTKRELSEQLRPAMSFNRVAPVVDAVTGQQIANRQEVRYIPREEGDVKVNELLTGAASWFRDLSEADDEDSDAFYSCAVAGMGWTDTRMEFEERDDGDPSVECIPAEEMVWDCNAKRPNLTDARRLWRVRCIALDAAEEMFEGRSRMELDAAWARGDGRNSEQPYVADEPRNRSAGRSAGPMHNEVTIVQVQWIERKPVMMVADPMTGQIAEFEPKQYDKLKKRFGQMGMKLQGTKRMRKVRKQAFLGGVVLDVTDAPCPDEFSWQCVTGKRDPVNGYWYGIVRAMIEPQEWANKWLSQMLHLMNASAKGGLMAERGTAGNIEEVEESWAANDAITWFENGSISQGKVQPKPMQGIPPQLIMLTELAISSIRDVSGVNLEMLGMREAVLQWLFDGFRRYRRSQGKVILYYLQNDMSDGRLVRVLGKNGEKYVPLMREADLEYDIIVDEAPTAPNQKERTWQLISAIMPNVREMITPEVMLELLEYSPLPTSVVEKLREMAEAAQQSPEAAQQKEIQVRKAAADVSKDEADAFRSQMAGLLDQIRAQTEGAEAGKTQAETEKTMVETQQMLQYPPTEAQAIY